MTVLLPLLGILPLVAFWLWMVRDLTHHRYFATVDKDRWTFILVFGNVFGAAFYYWYEYRDRARS